MMPVIGLSFTEMVILRKVRTPRLISTFVAGVGASSLMAGYVFNLLAIQPIVTVDSIR